MNVASRQTFWTRPRLLGVALAMSVLALFIAANAHLIFVSFTSHPDCVLTSSKGGADYRAAKPSC